MFGTACYVILCHNIPTIFCRLVWLYRLHIFNREPCQSEASEIPAEQQEPKPKPRRKLHLTDVEHSRSRSGSRAALLQELDRLTNENKELSINVQQLSCSSQDSGYQQSEWVHVLRTLRNKETCTQQYGPVWSSLKALWVHMHKTCIWLLVSLVWLSDRKNSVDVSEEVSVELG
jgi:hypothetical protein